MNSTHATYAARLAALRGWMERENIDAFLLPVTDEYQGEYSAQYARRVTWLTGFDGSAGMAVIGRKDAVLLVDGRYTLQAEQEVDRHHWIICNSGDVNVATALEQHDMQGRVAFDSWLMTWQQVERLEATLGNEMELVSLQVNPVDGIWDDQPSRPAGKIVAHSLACAGQAHREKLEKVASVLHAKGMGAFVMTMPDAICWLLNIRGEDIPFNPLPLVYGIAYADGSYELFADPSRVDTITAKGLGSDVSIMEPAKLAGRLDALSASMAVGMDPLSVPYWFYERLAGGKVVSLPDPSLAMKATKNRVELDGVKQAHALDGAAVVTFLCWFDAQGMNATLDELTIVRKLEECRRQSSDYRGPSFATIAGSGPNGAIVHYRATDATNRVLLADDILLLDSGGQYAFGTTDITRTIARGEIPAEFRRHFTYVLKGHIALGKAIFPWGTSGGQLDALARMPLWENGLDYDHGTGHGVGAYLCVHEGPQRISKKGGDVALLPGMILSNEPGYYPTGAYGIRIENLVTVVEKPAVAGRRFLAFETLTLCPIDTRLIEISLLSQPEKDWLNAYHAIVHEKISPLLGAEEKQWLAERTHSI